MSSWLQFDVRYSADVYGGPWHKSSVFAKIFGRGVRFCAIGWKLQPL